MVVQAFARSFGFQCLGCLGVDFEYFSLAVIEIKSSLGLLNFSVLCSSVFGFLGRCYLKI